MNSALTEAVRLFNRGRFDAAGELCGKVLERDPDNEQALNILGGSLARSGKLAEAIRVAERVCRLHPGNAMYLGNLSYLLGLSGNAPGAVLNMARAVISDRAGTDFQARFARLVDHMAFYRETAESAVIRDAIEICLGNPDLDAQSFSTAWHSLILLDPDYRVLAARAAEGDISGQAADADVTSRSKFLSDPFLLRGLRSLHAVDAGLERVMTFLRRWFLVHPAAYLPETYVPFLCALAEHCMLNEYVYGCTPGEWEAVDALQADLERIDNLDATTMAKFALVCCYREPVSTERLSSVDAAGSEDGPDEFRRLLDAVVSMSSIKRTGGNCIPSPSSSPVAGDGTVSAAVARQYEENPYPRWRHLDIPVLSDEQKARARGKRILVAGCGTGYEPLNLAVHYPEAQVVGIDLSRPSLAYGQHMANAFGIENVSFKQIDILDLEVLGERFDLVSSVGVLHHMEDPVEGWRKLLACLEPDGFMKIGLYSTAARRSVALCRDWIEQEGFEPTPQGIRDFRQAIMARDAADPLREIMNWTDFWTMSMCRDLVFHVQEHTVTLPWIRSALDDLGLSLLSMRIGNPLFRNEYRSRYPDDRAARSLDHLHEFEMQNPAVFRDMYQFWCCRSGSRTASRPPAWFHTLGS